jgi:orotate phosphoribosyltransferase
MLKQDDVQALFLQCGALLEGHFLLSSGLHSNRYLQCALLLESPARAEQLGGELGRRLQEAGYRAATVISPALGGVIIGHEVARALGARHIFTERDAEGHAVFRRGFAVRPGEAVVVVEDVVTTGLSTREVIEVARAGGAQLQAVASIVDRSGGTACFDRPFISLLQLSAPTYPPDKCPLCAQGTPAVKPGSRK